MNLRRKKGWMDLKVSKIVRETHDTVTLYLVDPESNEREFDYIAGQYLTFRFDDLADKPIVRSYTMSSSPCQPDAVAVTVKEVENGFVSKFLVRDVKEGDTLRARGPIGRFVYDGEKDEKQLVMVAAGSGVTPFLSILRQYAGEPPTTESQTYPDLKFPDKMRLLVSYRSDQDLICWDLLEELKKSPRVEVVTTLSRQEKEGFLHGRVDAEMIGTFVGDPKETTFMTCGPEAVMNTLTNYLESQGVPSDKVKTESFD